MQKKNILSYFPIRFGWIVSGNETSKKLFLENVTLLTHPSPTWFRISKDGAIIGTIDKDIVKASEEYGLALCPLVSNTIPNKGFSAELFHEFITNKHAKRRFIQELSSLVSDYEIKGINIDFEYFLPTDESLFVNFLELLKDELPELIVSVDLPPVVDTEGTAWTYQLDNKKIAAIVDYLVFMMYDYSWPKSGPGPICPLSWLRKNITAAKEIVPKNKIVMALPLYGYDWSEGNATGLSSILASQIAEEHKQEAQITIGTDSESFEYFFEYIDSKGRLHKVYYQSKVAIVKRLEVLSEEGISDISFWYWGAAPVDWFFTN